jgi:ComF family protein
MREPPLYRKARAAFRYDEHSRKLITRFKYNDGTYLLPTLTDMLERAGSELITQSDLIIPVPLHTKRLLARRYNQSAMLAASLSKQTGVPTLLNGITRTRNTPQQAGLTKRQREKNMQGAFNIPEKYKPHIAHQSVLLIDDVMTTGSTLLSCTKALLKAKAKDVYVLTLARTVNPL